MPQNKVSKKPKVTMNHRFMGCRDALVSGTTSSTPSSSLQPISTNSGGSGSGNAVLTPIGLSGSKLNASGVVYDLPVLGNIAAPQLRGLYFRASDFQMYRVTRAKLVFVGATGSTATGQITLAAYTDPLDVSNNTTAATNSSSATRTFDVASAAGRELSVPIPVDSSWKKISAYLTTRADVSPFYGSTNGIIPLNSVSDLSFGAISWYVSNSLASQATIGTLFIDYDVEFKGPIDFALNT